MRSKDLRRSLEEIRDEYADYLERAEILGCKVYNLAGKEKLYNIQETLDEAMNQAGRKLDLDLYNFAAVLYNGITAALNEAP